MTIVKIIRSWLLLVPLVPSTVVTVFNLYHLLTIRALRKALNNHVIILLLIAGLIEALTNVVFYIHFYRTGIVLVTTPAFCVAWTFSDSAIYVSIFMLMAWASIERHILIFHQNLLATTKKRILFHYVPLVICILWPVIFYFVMLVMLPCSVSFNYERIDCNHYNCLGKYFWASWVDSLNSIMPAFVTVVFSAALLVRVIYTRYRVRGRIDWRNYKKMALQLLPISILYIAMQLPPMLLYVAYTAGLSWNVAASYYSDAFFFTYWVVLFTPFATVVSLPDLKTKCKKLLFWRKPRAVHPETLAMTRRNVGQTVAGTAERAAPAAMKPATAERAAPAAMKLATATLAAPEAMASTAAPEAMTSTAAPEVMASTAAPEVMASTAAPSTAVTVAVTEAMVPEGKTLAGTTSTSMLPTTMGQGGMPAVDV